MKNILRISLVFAALTACAFGQLNTFTQTSLSAAITSSQNTIVVASATNIAVTSGTSNGSMLYIVDPGQTMGELVHVTSVNGTTIGVRRDALAKAHVNASMVLVGQPGWFSVNDKAGSCTAATTLVTPAINTNNGRQFVCSTITLSWVAGWGNFAQAPEATILVASVAGATAVNSQLQHINGTNAITAFTMSAGWNGQGFCIIPDAAFTTTATSNIAKASTAVANKTEIFLFKQYCSGTKTGKHQYKKCNAKGCTKRSVL